MKKSFGSDNFSGVHPNILQAIEKANLAHAQAYGYDEITENGIEKLKETFGENIDAYFVYNGTGANVTILKTLTKSYQAVLSPETAHINVDECGALENFIGAKIIDVPTENGKLTVSQLKPYLQIIGDEHHSQPKVISLTQVTELGTVYTKKELINITDFAHKNNLYVHMDGARLANAATYLNCSLKEITADVNIDALSFGGTKNGLMFGETVIFFNKDLSTSFKFYRKQGMQLHSKMRFIASQFTELLKNNLWLENAKKANEMAAHLEHKIKDFNQIEILYKRESNAIFARMERKLIDFLHKEFFFYFWNEEKNEVRLMTSFDTEKKDIEKFVKLINDFYKN